jgi:hypothetical protein
VHSPTPGFFSKASVQDKSLVTCGESIVLISPSESQVWEALRALFLVGEPQDLFEVEAFAKSKPQMSERVRQQAVLTLKTIKERSKLPESPSQIQ